jgi:hypothetical protein
MPLPSPDLDGEPQAERVAEQVRPQPGILAEPEHADRHRDLARDGMGQAPRHRLPDAVVEHEDRDRLDQDQRQHRDHDGPREQGTRHQRLEQRGHDQSVRRM